MVTHYEARVGIWLSLHTISWQVTRFPTQGQIENVDSILCSAHLV